MRIEGVANTAHKNNIWEIESETEKDIRPAIFKFAVENNFTYIQRQCDGQSPIPAFEYD